MSFYCLPLHTLESSEIFFIDKIVMSVPALHKKVNKIIMEGHSRRQFVKFALIRKCDGNRVVLIDKAVLKKEMDNAHINKTCG